MKHHHNTNRVIHFLAAWGCVSTGIVYFAIGLVAILSFLKLKDGGADEASLLVYLNEFVAGKIVIWIVLLGTLGYIVWRVYETIYDPFGYGKNAKGVLKRAVVALSSFADAMIAYTALQALTGTGNANETGVPTALRQSVDGLLQTRFGPASLVAIGIVTLVTAVIQVGYVAIGSYTERLNIQRLGKIPTALVHVLAWLGHFARGAILFVIGMSFLKASFSLDATSVVNTDKAFDFIGDNIGHVYFIATAVGTVCYGLFMFVLGWYYDSDMDAPTSKR